LGPFCASRYRLNPLKDVCHLWDCLLILRCAAYRCSVQFSGHYRPVAQPYARPAMASCSHAALMQ
jgi:hypothetical protein